MASPFRVKPNLSIELALFPSYSKRLYVLSQRSFLFALAFLLLLSLTSASLAVSTEVSSTQVRALRGISVGSYYTDEPSTFSPITVHTTAALHGASGFFIIHKGESAYFWSPQFPESTAIPQGRLVLDLWAQPMLLDSDEALTVSAYTTASDGTIQSTLFAGQPSNPVPQESGQVTSVFAVTAGVVPAGGYVELVLSAPETSPIKVYWGTEQPSNFQLNFAFS